jgi:hypothetical protein
MALLLPRRSRGGLELCSDGLGVGVGLRDKMNWLLLSNLFLLGQDSQPNHAEEL